MKLLNSKKLGKARVYDIEVAKVHNFFANGINVHNCATDGGVSVTDGPAGIGTVVDLYTIEGGHLAMRYCTFRRDGSLCMTIDTDYHIKVVHSLPSTDLDLDYTWKKGSADEYYTTYYGADPFDLFLRYRGITGLADCYIGETMGFSLIAPEPSAPATGAIAYMSTTYNTGMLRGDIQLATLADTTPGDATGTIPDRSVKGNDVTVVGTLTKTAVASGAELVAYGGFSDDNYGHIPFTEAFNFGQGDFSFSVWVNLINNDQFIFDSTDSAGYRVYLYQYSSDGTVQFYIKDGNGVTISTPDSGHPVSDGVHLLTAVKSGNTAFIYVDGELLVSTSGDTVDLTTSDAEYFIGTRHTQVDSFASWMSLFRISKTAPTLEQIKADYLAERSLFQENAKCTLSGTSNEVKAIDYDSCADRVIVMTDKMDIFQGLVNVSQSLISDTAQCVSAEDSAILYGTSTQAKFIKPEQNLREELAKRDTREKQFGFVPQQFRFTGDGSTTDFTLESGWKAWAVYGTDGTLQLEGSADDYTSISNVVSFAVAPSSADFVIFAIPEVSYVD